VNLSGVESRTKLVAVFITILALDLVFRLAVDRPTSVLGWATTGFLVIVLVFYVGLLLLIRRRARSRQAIEPWAQQGQQNGRW
jgi:UPF0716 family protein affecting phage T7 exclusion